jgi:transposase/DNA-directed RNA polymerase subunit RPC12/RpoP
MDKDFLEDCLAKGMSLEAIGRLVGRHPSTVGYWLRQHELTANGSQHHAAKGQLKRAFLETAVGSGLTIAEMASEFDRSKTTIRYWLRRYGLQATGGTRRSEAREARELGLRHVELRCTHHGRTMFVLENRGSYRCMRCRAEKVVAWRRRAKERLVAEAGGRCQRCGYDRFLGALHFHHIDPESKSFSLSMRGCTRSFAELRAEAAKCVLLCANCHATVEWELEEAGAVTES